MKHTIILFSGFFFALASTLQGNDFSDEGAVAALIEKMIDNSELNTPLLDMSAAPSSIIGGAVNVITGSYVESTSDLVIQGANSLAVERSFNSGNNEKGSLCHGWNLNFHGDISIYERKNDEGEVVETHGLVNNYGAKMLFEGGFNQLNLRLNRKQLKYGVTNCNAGFLNSRTNIKNKKLNYKSSKTDECKLYEESGEILTYVRSSGLLDENIKYIIRECLLPNGCFYFYDYDKKDRLSKITSRSKGGTSLSRIEWLYPKDFDSSPELTLRSSDGRKILYKFQKQSGYDGRHHRISLKSVTRDYAPQITYSYRYASQHSMDRLVKKTFPENRFLKIQYYEQGTNIIGSDKIHISDRHDSRVGRVAALYAPVGKDSLPVMTSAIKYHLDKDHRSTKPIGGYAEVLDALEHKKIYRFSDEQRLTSIEHLLDTGDLYRKEIMKWEDTGEEKTFLLSNGLTDSKGRTIFRKDYTYDRHGNVLKEYLWGNLTGKEEKSVKWNSAHHLDKFTKTYTYTDEGLLASESDGRRKITYKYVKDKNLVKLKVIADKEKIRERFAYSYDSAATLIKEINDDGKSLDINDLKGVTERRIKKITPTKSHPFGLPAVIKEYYLDIATKEEKLLNCVENSYSKEGHLLSQKFFDCNGIYCFSKEWIYDSHGNVTQEKDPLGNITTYRYDQNDNRIFQQTPNNNYYTEYTYDYANRLIEEITIYKEEFRLLKSFSYDYMGNRTLCVDQFGNITKFRYDEFGRLIEKTYPPILNSIGELVELTDKVAYDVMNNPCEKTDTNGFTTTIKYTSIGKPYKIEGPDGSEERNIYHLDGTLESCVDVNGVQTQYKHDYKGRKISEEKIAPNGESLSLKQWTYSTFHLMEEIDPAGHKTIYTYDFAGRQDTITKCNSEIKYFYDSLGRQSEIWEMYEPGKYQKTICEYDNLNRLISERIVDVSDGIFTSKSCKFDSVGNRTHEILHNNDENLCTEMQFSPEKKPLKIIQPDGHETNYIYYPLKTSSSIQPDGSVITSVSCMLMNNEMGQNVAYEEEIDPNGNRTLKLMDTWGRLAKEEKKDPKGKMLQKSAFTYDGEGNQIQRNDALLIDGEFKKNIRTEFLYDSKNREVAVIEAAGDPLQKITRKEYHLNGEVSKIIKPDGVIICHEYDDLNRLNEMYSSDGTVHYRYTHDQNSNLVKVEDLSQNMLTTRTIDDNDRMVSEKLGTGLEFIYQYDAKGRVTQLILPDMSSVWYNYNATNLCSIDLHKNGHSYSCDYQFYLSGKVAKINFGNNLGPIKFNYDQCLRPINIECDNWVQAIPELGYDPCGNLLEAYQKDAAGEFKSCYTYDSLHHLIAETGSSDYIYAFDSLHNRLKKNDTNYSSNTLNQLMQQGTSNYEYDQNGNQSKKSNPVAAAEYHYDALDRLTTVICENQKTEYLYDSFHRRLKKTIFVQQDENWVETKTYIYLFQGDKEIGAIDNSGNIIEMRTLGLGLNGEIGAAVFLEVNNNMLKPIHDLRGNVCSLTNYVDGQVQECYRYSAYGEDQIFDENGNKQKVSICPWRFSSKRVDAETGWVYYGKRYYDAEVGKWTTPDPLRFIDSANVYCFVRNRPMKFIDPDGRMMVLSAKQNMQTVSAVQNAACNAVCSGASAAATFAGNHYETVAPMAQLYFNVTLFPRWAGIVPSPVIFHRSREFNVGVPCDDGIIYSWINGMENTFEESQASAQMISDMAGGHEVLGVYNASFGIVDPIECAMGLAGIVTQPVKLLAKRWNECPKNTRICHHAHSQGMIHTRNALNLCDSDVRERITIRTFASAAHIQEGVVENVQHFESSRDFVSWFDKFLGNAANSTITTLEPHPDANWHDHSFNSPTFQIPLQDGIDDFSKKNGRQQ